MARIAILLSNTAVCSATVARLLENRRLQGLFAGNMLDASELPAIPDDYSPFWVMVNAKYIQ